MESEFNMDDGSVEIVKKSVPARTGRVRQSAKGGRPKSAVLSSDNEDVPMHFSADPSDDAESDRSLKYSYRDEVQNRESWSPAKSTEIVESPGENLDNDENF